MAIVKMSKFRLFSFKEDSKKLLEELQRFNFVHFSKENIEAEEVEKDDDYKIPESMQTINEELSNVDFSLGILEKLQEKPSMLEELNTPRKAYSLDQIESIGKEFDSKSLAGELRTITKRIEGNRQKINNLEQEKEEYYPWIGFNTALSELGEGDRVSYYLGTFPTSNLQNFYTKLSEYEYTYAETIYTKGAVTGLYLIVMDEDREALNEFRQLGFNPMNFKTDLSPKMAIERIEEEVIALKRENEELENELEGFTTNLDNLRIKKEALENEKLKLLASEKFYRTDQINVVTGFIPKDMEEEFKSLLDKNFSKSYYLELEDADTSDDSTPILLKNGKLVTAFESITKMYSLPKYGEIDPTPIFTLFYWFFFGMMVADLGYGIFLFIVTGLGLKFFKLDEEKRNFLQLFFYISISTMMWGIINGSFFGYSLPFGLINAQEDPIKLLVLSVIFGAVNLLFGLAVKAYLDIRDGRPMDAVYDVLTWYLALIGAGGLLISKASGASEGTSKIFLIMMIVGMVGIVLFANREAKSAGARLAGGFYELYGISSYVGDLVSYTRLMALSLSGAFIAFAVNLIFSLVNTSVIGLIFGLIILLIGHVFNLFLSLLSAYVHTARLTYVEFFGKFFEGGGIKFNKFTSESKYFDVK